MITAEHSHELVEQDVKSSKPNVVLKPMQPVLKTQFPYNIVLT